MTFAYKKRGIASVNIKGADVSAKAGRGFLSPIYGLAKSLSVMPGDTIKMQVYAKYLDPDANNWTSALGDFMAAVAGGTAPPGTVVDGGVAGSIGGGSFPFPGLLNHSGEPETAPKAYLNYIVFDRDFNPLIGESGFIRITTASKEDGSNVPHDLLKPDQPLVIKQAGYVYIYLSNENETPVEVFFDDFTVEHIKSPVVQMDDYYPFGLAFNSYQRENTTKNNYLYNGKELQDEMSLGNYDYGFRTYDPAIGRWTAPDPLAELGFSLTPFRYCFNNPINYTDPFGLWEKDANGNYSTTDKDDIERFLSYLTIESSVLNSNPSMDQINGFIEGEESESGLGKLSDGSHLVSAVSVTGYDHGNHINWYTDKKSLDRAWDDVQGYYTPDILNPRTLGKNFLGLSYPGGENPRKYNGDYDYSYAPIRLSEYPAIGHDRRYDNLGIAGKEGLFKDTRSIGADWKFVGEEFAIAAMPIDLKTRWQALRLGLGLGLAATPKTLLKLATPQPATSGAAFAEVMMWYSVSNSGVTNKPE